MSRRRKRAIVAALVSIGALAGGAAAATIYGPGPPARRTTVGPLAGYARWSAPRRLTACSGPGGPHVLFPQQTPLRRTGEGAIVFMGRPGCRVGEDAAVAAIGPGDRPGPPRQLGADGGQPTAISAPLATIATAKGQIAIAGSRPSSLGAPALALAEGPASGAFAALPGWPAADGPVAVTSAYLGDVALAACSASNAGGVQLRIQRHFQRALHGPVALGGGGRPSPRACNALSVALDYRSDAMAVWWHDGWLYARERRQDGALGPLQRFARASAKVQLAVAISDDNRAIVAWVDPRKRSAGLHLDISRPGMLLGSGETIERLRWDGGGRPDEGWVRLVRRSDEGVLMAWTGTEGGHFAVRSASVTLRGLRGVRTLSAQSEAAVLDDLATGPHGDALALWTASKPVAGSPRASARLGRPHAGHTTVMADWMAPHPRASAGPGPQLLARVAQADARAAIDPSTGTAIVVWREGDGAIRYVLGRPSGA